MMIWGRVARARPSFLLRHTGLAGPARPMSMFSDITDFRTTGARSMSMFSDIKDLSTTMKGLRKELRENMKDLNRNFGGYITNTTMALEEEVVLAVYNALLKANLAPEEPLFNVGVLNLGTGKTLCKPDGLIRLRDGSWTVIEVGNMVNEANIRQMMNDVNCITGMGHTVSYKFLGGPSFKHGTPGEPVDIKQEALELGYGVVCGTGDRYHVTFPPPPPRRPPPAPSTNVLGEGVWKASTPSAGISGPAFSGGGFSAGET